MNRGSELLSRVILRVLQFCADVPPGNARAKECLEDSREQPGFSPGCKEEVEKMMASRATDFRLDPKLRQLCADDIQVRPRTRTALPFLRRIGVAKKHPGHVPAMTQTVLALLPFRHVMYMIPPCMCELELPRVVFWMVCGAIRFAGWMCRMCAATSGTPWTLWLAMTHASSSACRTTGGHHTNQQFSQRAHP